jgi:CBS domain-containing protein
VVADIAHDAGTYAALQTAESRELISYSCGHEVPGPSISSADQERLEVERRTSAETTDIPERRLVSRSADAGTDGTEVVPMSILVRHAMTESPKTLGPTMTAEDAAGMMAQFDFGVVPVVDGARLIGLVTDRDLVVRVLAGRKDPADVKLGDIATGSLVTATPDMGIAEARGLMAEHRVRRLPVMKGDALVGVVSLGDLALADPSNRAIGDTLEEVSTSDSTSDLNDGPERGTPDRVRTDR